MGNVMTESVRRLTFIADDQRLAAGVLAHLEKGGETHCVTQKFGDPRDLADMDGSLLLLVASPAEVESARPILQEAALRRLPVGTFLLATEGGYLKAQELSGLAGPAYLWPRDAQLLQQALRSRPVDPRLRELAPYPENSTEYAMARKLLPFTPSLGPMVERLALAAEHEVTVLLTGHTGTGKTYLARLIHQYSPRRDEKFLIVPCGALAPNLVESELFGHVRGAFTGADRARQGKFAAAGKGTLLLDEIDALPLEQQANLLRVVETGEYEPVGSNETLKSACRLIVASNWNLKEAVEKGRFRQDLYYRFNVMSFHLPPLRERIEDIEPLVRGMAARFSVRFKKDLCDISPEALSCLESYPWPGNLRELENAVQHAVLVSQGPTLQLANLPEAIKRHAGEAGGEANGRRSADSLVHNREVVERTVILRALANNNYSRSRAAHELGVSRVTLYKKMKKYGLLDEPARPLAQ